MTSAGDWLGVQGKRILGSQGIRIPSLKPIINLSGSSTGKLDKGKAPMQFNDKVNYSVFLCDFH